jgi:hypothetical protein
MNMQREVEREVIDAAQTDFTGLYEVLWRLNVTMPDVRATDRQQLAEEAVRSLLLRGLIDVYRRANGTVGAEVRLDAGDAVALLATAHAWRAPSGGSDEILFATTADGMRLYRRSASRPS